MAYNMKYWLNGLPIKHFILGIVIVFLIGGTAGYFVFANKITSKKVLSASIIKPTNTPTPIFSPTPSSTPTPTIRIYEQKIQPQPTKTPLLDCVGADGKHMQITQKACNDFNKAWGYIPTQTPQPQTNEGSTTLNTNSNSSTQSINTQQTPIIVIPNNTYSAPVVTPDCSGVSSTIASIKNGYAGAMETANNGEAAYLAARGLTSNGGQLSQAQQSVLAQENLQIAQFCINVIQMGCSCP
jgi:hypothetical protein